LVKHTKYGQHRMECPWCGPDRRKKGEETLSYNRDNTSIKYMCHHCAEYGLIVLEERRVPVNIEEKKPIIRKRREEFGDLGDPQIGWLSGRGISVSTAGRYDLIGDEIFGKPIVGFPYYDEKGNVVARPMMYLALTYDHRLIDGREGVTFLKSVADKITDPARLVFDI
jgi:hypothetical protein